MELSKEAELPITLLPRSVVDEPRYSSKEKSIIYGLVLLMILFIVWSVSSFHDLLVYEDIPKELIIIATITLLFFDISIAIITFIKYKNSFLDDKIQGYLSLIFFYLFFDTIVSFILYIKKV